MAAFIVDTLAIIDDAILGYAEAVYQGFAGPVTTVIQALGLFGIAFIGINAVLQFIPVRISDYLKWAIRYVIVLSVATSWAQFSPIYNILTNVPGEIGGAMIAHTTGSAVTDINTALDEVVTAAFEFSQTAFNRSGLFGVSLVGWCVWLMGSVMACVAIIVVTIAKTGLGMSVAMAPVFLAALLFKATSDLFQTWARFTLGFALIPLVQAGVIGAVLGVAGHTGATAADANAIVTAGSFVVVLLAAIYLTYMVPAMVNGLAGTIVATAGAAAAAQKAGRMAGHAGGAATSGGVRTGRKLAESAGQGLRTEGPAQARIKAGLAHYAQINREIRQGAAKIKTARAEAGRSTSVSDRRAVNQALASDPAARRKLAAMAARPEPVRTPPVKRSPETPS